MKSLTFLAAAAALIGLTDAQNSTDFNTTLNSMFSTTGPRNVRIDTGTYGPPVEEFHYYYYQWPIGLAVSKQGRVFACYARGTYAYTLGEIVNQTPEQAYSSQALNTPPGGLYNVMNGIQFGSNDLNTFISVQALYITPDDTLWVLDTGRPQSTSPKLRVCHMLLREARSSFRSTFPTTRSLDLHTSAECSLPRFIHERSLFRYATKRYSFRWRNCMHRGLEQRRQNRLHHD